MRHRWLALLLTLGLVSPVWGATSQQKVVLGTPVSWCDPGQGCTYNLTLQNLTSLSGRSGDRHDKGTGAQPAQWLWQCSFTLVGTKVPGAALEIWVSWSDGTYTDGALGTTNAALAAADKRRNLKLLGQTQADSSDATTGNALVASGMAWLPSRYFIPVIYNATTLPTQNTATGSKCQFTPVLFEMQ